MSADSIEDGGPAFPSLHEIGDIAYSQGGMTLRDWFAAQALTSLGGVQFPQDGQRASVSVAKLAYEVADAMLAARKGGDQ